ncbi:MAG: hypothetical protein H5U02_11170 [Clostridia bacterium]|nr:hypothetical protein [Clostridia bacterium]
MKVIGVVGSPRREGNTEILVETVLAGLTFWPSPHGSRPCREYLALVPKSRIGQTVNPSGLT